MRVDNDNAVTKGSEAVPQIQMKKSSHLEATRLAAAARHLELPAAGAHARPRGGAGHARGLAEVALGGAGLGGAAEEHGALALGGAEGQLVEGDALALSLLDARAGGLGEAQGADLQGGEVDDPPVICDRADHNCCLALLALHPLLHLGRPASLDVDTHLVLPSFFTTSQSSTYFYP